MPDPAGTHSDGSLQFGSQVVTIGGVNFVAEDISYELGTKELTRRNQYNVPEAEVLLDDIGTGSMTLQLPAADTAPPLRGDPFTLIDAGGASLPMKISKVGRTWKSDSLIMLKVDIRQKLN
jgi:hypothetical protein